jgi:uncharacterized protein YcnI
LPVPSNTHDRRGALGVLLACLALAAVVAPAASGHTVIRPAASRPADLQQYTLTVPTEREVATVEIDMKVPEGISFFLVQQAPGWTTEVVRRNERIDEVRWTGSEIPPDHYATFRFIARNPIQEGEISWPIVQRYEGGETVRWIGGPDTDTPAARTNITESAVPEDVVDIVSGSTSSGEPTPTDEADDSGSGGSRDGLTLGLAVAALVAGLAALGVSLIRRGRRTA